MNISLDALSEQNFQKVTRRKGLHRVLEGIEAAKDAGFERTRLNAVAIRGITEDEAIPLARFAREHKLELRFIEFMPLDAEANWQSEQVLNGETLRALISAELGALVPCERTDPSQPAFDFEYADGGGRVGFIDPVSQPFCSTCNRLRITADGKIRNCLFSMAEWDARAVLRSTPTTQPLSERLQQLVRDCVWQKKPAHGIDSPEFQRPARAMYQIGG